MAKWHDDRMERSMASRLDRAKERQRSNMLYRMRENQAEIANRVAMKLIDSQLLETTSKSKIEEQLFKAMDAIHEMEEFDVNLAVADYRELVHNPNFIVLYLTVYVVETLINNDVVIDVFGSDEDIYLAIASQVEPYLARRKRQED